MSNRPHAASDVAYTLHHYGESPSQFLELVLPSLEHGEQPSGVAVVIHGGYWRATYGADLGLPLAADLAQHGWVAANLEYRRIDGDDPEDAGGWPATFEDVAAGIDALADLLPESYRELPVYAVGHSAGGHLAVWAAHRSEFDAGAVGAEPRVRLAGVVSQAGLLDLHLAHEMQLSDDAAGRLMGSTPVDAPEDWHHADPARLAPAPVDVVVLHPEADEDVPAAVAHSYCEAAAGAGASPRFRPVPGDHLALIDPESRAWKLTLRELARLAGLEEAERD
ncbi:alpha/beta hydrolase [Zhihengliuella sp.]|uniref:alpha/beta hydrolase family protein n=1 Tax=Zhihengliuella sp. TaxID=1954483 RepID=UPI002811ACDB|nr:alpha/beta hydrolase [Zhihengliuella sp.]